MKKTIMLQLRSVLVKLYADELSIRRVIHDADLDASLLVLNATITNYWFSILTEAEKTNQIEALLQVVELEYSSNQELCNACDAYRQSLSTPIPKPGQGHANGVLAQAREPLMNCEKEMKAFHAMLHGADRQIRAIVLQGDHGCGKTRLLNEYRYFAATQARVVVHFDLGQQLTVERCLERVAEKIADYDAFPELQQGLRSLKPDSVSQQREWQKQLTLAFFADLRQLPTASDAFLFFDHFEKADRAFRTWFLDEFIARLEDKALAVVVAGRFELEMVRALEWVHFFTPKIPNIDHFDAYIQRVGVQVDADTLSAMFTAFHATPKGFVDYVNALRLQQQGVSA